MSNEVELLYSQALMSKVDRDGDTDEFPLKNIRYIMIQMTSDRKDGRTDTALNFYDAEDLKNKKHSHYVVDSRNIVKYLQSTDLALNDEKFLNGGKKDEIMVVEIVWNNVYGSEEVAVKFLSNFLFKWDLPLKMIRRRTELIDEEDIFLSLYNKKDNWESFLRSIQIRVDMLKKQDEYNKEVEKYNEDPDLKPDELKKADTTEIVVKHPESAYPELLTDWAYEPVSIEEVKDDERKETKDIHDGEDFKKDPVLGGKINQFTKEAIRDLDKVMNGVEPIYPDLTVPPRGNPTLYVEKIYKLKDMSIYHKHTVGDVVNRYAPYPVEQKVAELQAHRPKVKLEEGEASGIGEAKQWLMALSERTEKRLVQLENITSTLMRSVHRMSSRININCVYYGGQATYYKYRCIRCMNDDLVNDKQLVTLDQCLNCSRYEPIEGQIYDIVDDDLTLNLAPFLDDNQMARNEMEDFIMNAYTEEMRNEMPKYDFNFSDINTPPKDTVPEEWKKESEGEYFEMEWAETNLEENFPDINDYEYNPAMILEDKYNIVDNPRKHGLQDIEKIDIKIMPDSYGITSSGGVDIGGIGGMYTSDVRVKIVDSAKAYFQMNKEGKAGYRQEWRYTTRDGIYYLDCSSLASKCYKEAGLPHAGGDTTAVMRDYFINKKKGSVTMKVSEALPGDLVLWPGHVAIYIGDGMIIDASTKAEPLTENYKHRHYTKVNKPLLGFCRTDELIQADKMALAGGAGIEISNKSIMEAVNKYGNRPEAGPNAVKAMAKWGYKNIFLAECMKGGVDPNLMLGLVARESEGNPTLAGTKGNDYHGLFQLEDGYASSTKAGMTKNIRDGIAHYKRMKKYGESEFKVKNLNPMLALYVYNSGQGNIGDWLRLAGVHSRANQLTPIQLIEALRIGYKKKTLKGDTGDYISRSMYGVMAIYYAEQYKEQGIFRQ